MATKSASRLTISVSSEFRDELKIQAIAHGKTMKDYVVEALMDKLRQDSIEEDKAWGELSERAKREDFVGLESSKTLLERMKNA